MNHTNIRTLPMLCALLFAACGDPSIKTGGDCRDADRDGYGIGSGCDAVDCNDDDPAHWDDCLTCSDIDGDGYGPSCNRGRDCDPRNAAHWSDCGRCVDSDGDGRGEMCNAGTDCDDANADVWDACAACVDGDGDGAFVGCNRFVARTGPDCDDSDPFNSEQCATCADLDGDGRYAGCDRYDTDGGPDCDDHDANVWGSCRTCQDGDADGFWVGCDAYATVDGPDCDDTLPLVWTQTACEQCVPGGGDSDGDGRGTGCDLGTDCNDADEDNWASCDTCDDVDADGYFGGCDAYVVRTGPDCNDGDANVWERCDRCVDADGDGQFADCDAYATRNGPDCNDGNPNVWISCGACRDGDRDGFYANCDAYSSVLGPDCADYDNNNWDSCVTCIDGDGDGWFAGCDAYETIPGEDCDDDSPNHWDDCATCTDTDGDGRGTGTCRLGSDCAEGDPRHWSDCDTCTTDLDEDGRGGPTCDLGSDCLDSDANVWDACGACLDTDSDGYYAGCDAYATVTGPDCAPSDTDNWISCDTCLDVDGDGWFDGCDRYTLLGGAADCAPGDPLHWADCGVCDDDDSDGYGSAGLCDLGTDCAPGDGQHWLDCGTCNDATTGDGDGYGASCDLGDDCCELGTEPACGGAAPADVHPGATDDTTDGTDQNCDGLDGPFAVDDFESGSYDAAIWQSVQGSVTSAQAADGVYSLNLDYLDAATSVPLDFGACSGVAWSYSGKRGPNAPPTGQSLYVEYFNGSTWVEVDRLTGDGTEGPWEPRVGFIDFAAGGVADFQLRFGSSTSSTSYDFYVDDVRFGCDTDGDGDGWPDTLDCASADPQHWLDCGACTDRDGDGLGVGCDLGEDCNDTHPGVNASLEDTFVDGLDQNCDGFDGPAWRDDFETGAPNASLWQSTSGYSATSIYVPAEGGSWALGLDSYDSMQTYGVDVRECQSISWAYYGKRGPNAPATYETLSLYYHDGTSWVEVDRMQGQGVTGPWELRFGRITDSAALALSDFQFYFSSSAAGIGDFYIDEFAFGCTARGDGDDVPEPYDCAPADPLHWSDCGACTDLDRDGYGTGCDLGTDCDDTDPATHPGNPDFTVDGRDQNCDGYDGMIYSDDFETGELKANLWSSDGSETYGYTTTASYVPADGGVYAINLDSDDRITTLPIDTTRCNSVSWSFDGKSGPFDPESYEFLVLEWWDGVMWNEVERIQGLWTAPYADYAGVITDSAARRQDFRMRFRSSASSSSDDFYVDNFVFGC